MAIEIKHEKKNTSLWQDIFLVFSLVLIIISFGIYIYYANIVVPEKEKTLRELNTTFGSLTEADLKQKETELTTAYTLIEDFKVLLNNNPKTSKFFEAFPTWAHPKISFSGFNLNVQARTITMSGSTKSFRNVMEQIAILEREATVESFDIANINLADTGEITLDFNIILNPDLLK
jgi:hypothetical protein